MKVHAACRFAERYLTRRTISQRFQANWTIVFQGLPFGHSTIILLNGFAFDHLMELISDLRIGPRIVGIVTTFDAGIQFLYFTRKIGFLIRERIAHFQTTRSEQDKH